MFESRLPTINLVRSLDIPKLACAQYAGVTASRFSEYVHHRSLPHHVCARIEHAVRDVELTWRVLGCRVEISEPGFSKALAAAKQHLADVKLAEEITAAASPIAS